MIVALYLAAIVAANLISATFGPTASVFSAFAMIGATITLRDRLHDSWRGRGLATRMAVLVGSGALISWLISSGASTVAIASCVAFALSETADTLVYHGLRRWSWFRRVNGSNLVASAVDSLTFPTLAFGGFLWPIVLGQFVAKTLGGALWAYLLRRPALIAASCLALVLAAPADAQQQRPPRVVVQLQAGTAHYPWNDYGPVANAGLNALVFLPKGFTLLLVGSRDVQKGAPWVGIVALQRRLWSW